MLLGLGELFTDFNFVLRIFVFMTIVSFVQTNISNSIIALMVTVVFAWYALFVMWAFFGTIYLLYSLFFLGFASIIIDFFFVSQGGPASHDVKGNPGSYMAGLTGMKMAQMNARRRMMR